MNIRWPRMTGFGPAAWNNDDLPWDAFAKPRYKTEEEPLVLHPRPHPEHVHHMPGRKNHKHPASH